MFWSRNKRSADPDALATLSRRIDDVESTVRLLKSEWLDTLDRIERIAGRLAKRAVRDAPRDEAPDGAHTPVQGSFDPIAIRRNGGRFPGSGG